MLRALKGHGNGDGLVRLQVGQFPGIDQALKAVVVQFRKLSVVQFRKLVNFRKSVNLDVVSREVGRQARPGKRDLNAQLTW